MKPMDKLRKQHIEILEIINNIHVDLKSGTNIEGARSLLILFGQLSDLLERHLFLEDDFLYPALKKRSQENIRNIASQFSIELGGIKNIFLKYLEKWASADNIVHSHSVFMSESKDLISALQQRIAKEDQELFPLIGA